MTAEQTVIKKKRLQTIIVDNYYPYSFVNEAGQLDGFSVDLIKAVIKAMYLELDIQVDDWDKAQDSLKIGAIDLLPMMAYSKVRDQYFDFSVPHTIAFDAFFTRKNTKK
ncbi:transporter substrate-binding domain-containing protein [Desulfobacula toluolica]|nr:transporter substrate-binding domain-containing protein [Desulfobacula toluolica]